MKAFECREIEEAIAYAEAGGQALHLHQIIVDYQKAPRCFVDAVERGEDIAHLFDRDRMRLRRTAMGLGVNTLCLEHPNTSNQHIDLCGKPLQRAMRQCRLDARPSQGELFQCQPY